MELFRVTRTVYGQPVLQGMSWDLLWVFFGLGVAVIVIHAVYARWFAPKP
jgi:hypothetical protein